MDNTTPKPKKKEFYDIRNPYYKAGDGIEEIKTVVAKYTVFTHNDAELLKKVSRRTQRTTRTLEN